MSETNLTKFQINCLHELNTFTMYTVEVQYAADRSFQECLDQEISFH